MGARHQHAEVLAPLPRVLPAGWTRPVRPLPRTENVTQALQRCSLLAAAESQIAQHEAARGHGEGIAWGRFVGSTHQ